jgi:hypothetical protein
MSEENVVGQYFFGKWGWAAKDVGEVTFEKGEMMKVTEQNGEWWKGVFADGRSGWFPAARVRPLADANEIAILESSLKKLGLGGGGVAAAPVAAAKSYNAAELLDKLDTAIDEKGGAKKKTTLTIGEKRMPQQPQTAERDSGASKKDDSKKASLQKSSKSKPAAVDEEAAAQPQQSDEQLASPRGEPMPDVVYVRAKWPWKAKAPTEINIEKGELIRLTKKQGEWWKGKTLNGQHGWFPAARVGNM